MPTKKVDSKYVSSEPHEIATIVRRFKSYKTEKHLRSVDLKIIHALMTENLGKVKRAELEAVLALCGFGRDPQIDERK